MIRWGDAYLCQWPECDAPRHEGTEYCEAHLPTARLRRVGRSRPSAAQGVPKPSSHRDSLDAEEWFAIGEDGGALCAQQHASEGVAPRARYVKYVRLSTGDHVAVAHVIDRETGGVVASCGHRHKATRHPGQYDASGAIRYTSGTSKAEKCGDKLLRRFLKNLSPREQYARSDSDVPPEPAEFCWGAIDDMEGAA